MAEGRCYLCGAEFSQASEEEQLEHINACLDAKLTGLPPLPSPAKPNCQFDTTEMPKYAQMTKSEVQAELEKFGMKKTIKTQEARTMLAEIWLYQKYGVWPAFMEALQ